MSPFEPTSSFRELERLNQSLALGDSLSSISVLSVSPVLGDQEALERLLPSPAWTVYEARTMDAANELLHHHQPLLVLCERNLVEGSWRDLLVEINRLPNPPFLIVTTRLADEHFWAEALNFGAYDVLAKPFDSTELTRTLLSACMHRRKTSATGAARCAQLTDVA